MDQKRPITWGDFTICLLFGYLGIHRFIRGQAGMGVAYLLTMGLLGFGWITDCVLYGMEASETSKRRKRQQAASNQQRPQPKPQKPASKPEQETCGFGKIIGKELEAMDPIPVVDAFGIPMQPGEVCHFRESANRVKTKVYVRNNTGDRDEFSYEMDKDYTYHTGDAVRNAAYHEVTDRTPGTLIITSRRIIFTGTSGSFERELRELSSYQLFANVFSVAFNGADMIEIEVKAPRYTWQIIDRAYQAMAAQNTNS